MKKYAKLLFFALCMVCFLLYSIPAEAATVKLSHKRVSLIPGETFKLSVAGASSKVKWSSGRRNVAKVNSKGEVSAIAPGKTKITAKIGSKKYTCTVVVQNKVDIIVFAGQSNMTGNGDASLAPKLTQGAGYAYNYVTGRKKFSKLQEPFGAGQDDAYFANYDYAQGSMVTAFVNAYYKQTKTPVIAVPAAMQGSGSVSWRDTRYKGIIQRTNAAIKLAKKNNLEIGHVYMVWMQGENDAFADYGSDEMSPDIHKKNLTTMMTRIQRKAPVEACMMVCIGNYLKDSEINKYFIKIQNAQKALCKSNENFVLVSTKATKFSSSAYREDGLHIRQQGLNILGSEAGKKAGIYANSH